MHGVATHDRSAHAASLQDKKPHTHRTRVCLKAVSYLLAALLLLSFSGCSKKSVVFGISADTPPLSSRQSGQPTGFIVEMAREVGKRMGVEVSFRYVNMRSGASNFNTLGAGAKGVDVLWGQLEPGDQNKKQMLFTDYYLHDSQILLVESASKVLSRKNLSGKVIGAVSQTAAERALTKAGIITKKQHESLVLLTDPVSAFLALDSFKVSAIAVDESYALSRMTEHAEQYRILDGRLSSESYAVAVRRNDPDLRDAINKALKAMKADGTSTTISKKWFGRDLT